ncbi:hypothetical protein EUTSA_v10009976mg [Eutrema salsugineum]|uniref:Uncharacterized protein n=1 Tax=Eutrema salsugineum TaxID=72664 RepID=V4KS80_EUTSA|nr:uncharacterized protein LOC18992335 [Eutrema salsugineum]ESQ34139.1 hypothetical protein EUTSA_v10009976mg [Eutrema salsugineum]
MKIKNKGKVHPSPPPTPQPSSSHGDDCLSVLRLLPAVILALVSSLSAEDREVLAYLITRSLKTTTVVSAGGISPSSADSRKSSDKKRSHKPPLFDCESFDCYTSYWSRWDSSPNRELIHQIIEAFEDHLTSGESSASSRKSIGKGKKKDRRRVVEPSGRPEEPIAKIEEPVVGSDEVTPVKSPERLAGETEKATEIVRLPVAAATTTGHKGLARKVLPDVLGLFNSRFWSLLNPNA